jgi:hypothetical protein
MLQLQTKMVFFGVIHVFLQLRLIALFGRTRACLHLQNPKYQEVSIQKLSQFSHGNNVLDAPGFEADCLL